MTTKSILKKIGYIFAGLLLVMFSLAILGYIAHLPQKEITWGINFSTHQARSFGYEPAELFTKILDDLQVKHVRLPLYWNELEKEHRQYDFTEITTLLEIAEQRDVNVILALGRKLPRWPECHDPEWLTTLNKQEQDQALIGKITSVVKTLQSQKSIVAWQIENEPFFHYGLNCPGTSLSLYREEIKTVRQWDDQNRPIIGTDSGEKGPWITTAWGGIDIFGATMYRTVYLDKEEKYITYPLPAWTYNIKAGLIRILSGANKTIGVELQAEPWFSGVEEHWTQQEIKQRLMNTDILEQNIDYAKQAGFSENYFWGVEWWYWYAENFNDDSLIKTVKPLFAK